MNIIDFMGKAAMGDMQARNKILNDQVKQLIKKSDDGKVTGEQLEKLFNSDLDIMPVNDEAIRFKNNQELIDYMESSGFSHAKLAWTDHDGILRGKYVRKDKLYSALKSGLGFCNVVVGWDCNDEVYPESAGVKYTGWHTAFPDMPMKLDVTSARVIPFEEGVPIILCEAEDQGICPRGILKKTLAKADAMGFSLKAGFEFEFFMFDETPQSIREKNYQNLNNMTPGNFCYSVLRNSSHCELYEMITEMCEIMDLPVESIHTEFGPGVVEVALGAAEAGEAADRAALFKTFMKVLAQRNDMMATFMAKWADDVAGQSGHIHISMQDKKTGKGVFFDESKPETMSDNMRHFIAGQQLLMPQVIAMVAQTVNAFSRLVPGAWAPTSPHWGIENRTCAIRALKGSEKSQRIEYRIAAADTNPYLALSAAIATGLYGVEHKLEPKSPITGNAYEEPVPEDIRLPTTLWDAAQNFKNSKIARELFGDTFVDHFAATREWEERQYRSAITDWELKRYFEII